MRGLLMALLALDLPGFAGGDRARLLSTKSPAKTTVKTV